MVVGLAASPVAAEAEDVYFCNGLVADIVGTSGPDVLIGTPERDVIVGLEGADEIYGLGGNDVLCGDGGRDLIFGGGGTDRIYGGDQADMIRGGSGPDRLYGGGSRDLIRGDSGDDRLRGGGSADELRGGYGHDRIFGNGGDDDLYGSRGTDVCVGETETSCEVDSRNGPWTRDMWYDLVDEFFGDIDKTDDALVIVWCESRYNPFAINPNGKRPVGLWQFIPSTWDWATGPSGNDKWAQETRTHPRAATETARWLYDVADANTRRDGSDGQGFDPWVSCRCQLPDYRDLDACKPYI
jgi:Ca2+-binding RTX toxin-like protein